MRFKLYTLVDITETGARKGDLPKPIRQQQNFLTVVQTIGLRVNPSYNNSPQVIQEVPSKLGLGKKYNKKQSVWKFAFEVEYEGALDLDTLVNDFKYIPVITDLDETAKFENAAFVTDNADITNIIFEIDDK